MASTPDKQIWATATSTNAHNGSVIIFRYIQDFGPTFDWGAQPTHIIIVWKYQSEMGQPSADDYEQMNLLENALESVLEQDNFAILSIVATGEGLREWTYYAKSEDEFMVRLNRALAGMPIFPIEIHISHDPKWEMYEQFKARIGETVN
jgi:Family of unknown function (DUF695)